MGIINAAGSSDQELQARLSTDAHPHRLLLLQERHAAGR